MYKNNLYNVWYYVLYCIKDLWMNIGGNGCLLI